MGEGCWLLAADLLRSFKETLLISWIEESEGSLSCEFNLGNVSSVAEEYLRRLRSLIL